MHTVLLLSTLAWLCYLGAWLLLDFSLRNRLQVSCVSYLVMLHDVTHADMLRCGCRLYGHSLATYLQRLATGRLQLCFA